MWTKPGPGRPKGSINRERAERLDAARTFCESIMNSVEYRDSLRARAVAGTLAPQIESLLFFYCYGKPLEDVNVALTAPEAELSTMSSEELAARAESILNAIRGNSHDVIDVTPEPQAPSSPLKQIAAPAPPPPPPPASAPKMPPPKQTLENTPWPKQNSVH
jgi:hypothetical protein